MSAAWFTSPSLPPASHTGRNARPASLLSWRDRSEEWDDRCSGGRISDHVHVLLSLSRTTSVSKAVLQKRVSALDCDNCGTFLELARGQNVFCTLCRDGQANTAQAVAQGCSRLVG